jgi:hypothetical protein
MLRKTTTSIEITVQTECSCAESVDALLEVVATLQLQVKQLEAEVIRLSSARVADELPTRSPSCCLLGQAELDIVEGVE